MNESCSVVVSISLWDSIIIHLNAIILGIWLLLKRLLKWLWNRNAYPNIQVRDSPPACLVDSSLGLHSYVKLKVSIFFFVEKR